MSKQLNEWLDEFVDNGADPVDVTTWPENAGGSNGDILYPPFSEFTLNITELAKYIKTAEDAEGVNAGNYTFLYGYQAKGGSGVEPTYDHITVGRDYEGHIGEYFLRGTTSLGEEDIFFGNSTTQSMSNALIENKSTLEAQIFTTYDSILIGIMSGYEDYLYQIDLNKILVPVQQ